MTDLGLADGGVSDTTRNVRRTIALLLSAIVLMLGGFFWKMTQPRILTERELQEYGVVELQVPRKFSDFMLMDHQGAPFTQENLKGKWSLLFFGFTHCPDICPTTLAEVAAMYRELRPEEQSELQVVLVSLDPERDTTAQLAQYVRYFDPNFTGVSGNPFVTLKLATELNVAYNRVAMAAGDGADDYSIDHSANLVLINPNGHYHGFLRPPFRHGSMRVAWRSIRETF